MSFEVGKQVTNNNTSISRESFEKQEGINKLKKEELNAVWDRFDTNNDGQLDQDEQVGLMAFLKNLAATDEGKDDNKLTRKEVRHARKDKDNALNSFGDSVKLSYKDIKRVSNAFNNLVGDKGTEVQRKNAQNYTAGQNAYTINKDTGTINSKTSKAGTTNYKYDTNNDIEQKTVTEGEGQNKKVTTTEYQSFDGVKLKKKEETTVGTDNDKTVTTTQYTGVRKNGKPEAIKSQETVVHGDTEKTTDFDPNTGFKKQETIEHKDTKEKTVDKFDNKGGLANRTTTKDGKTVKYTTYTTGGATETLYDKTGNNITKEITYSNYNHQNGAVIDRTKTQETVYQKDKKITTTYKDGKKTGVTTTDTATGTVVTTTYKDGKESAITTKYKDGKSITHDRGKRQITVKTKEGKTTTVSTDENGNVATFPKFNGKRMETAGEAADRLGLKGKAKDDFIKKYGGEKTVLKAGTKLEIPKEAAIDKDFKADNVEVNGAAEAEKLKAYKAEQHRIFVNNNIAHAKEYGKAKAQKLGLRQTWASGAYQIYSKPAYAKTIETTDANGKKVQKTVSTAKEASKAKGNYQQHYIYNPQTGEMSTLESQIKGLKQGEHVKLITSEGYAKVVNDAGQERLIKLNFNSSLTATVDNKAAKTSDYNKNFKENYIASKGELKDADGNAIKNAEGKAIKTNLYEGRIVDGKVQSVMTHKEGIDLEAANRKALENADKMAKAKGYAKTDTPYLYSYPQNYTDDAKKEHTLVYYAYFNKNTNNFVDLGYKSIERARELFAEATKEPDTKHTTTQKQTNPDAEPGTVVDEKIADGQTPPAEETKTLTQAQVNNLAKKNGLTADTKHAGVYYKAQGHGVKTYYVYNTKSEKFEKTTVKTDETAVADNTRVASKSDEELPLPSYAAITSEALRKYNLIDTEKQEIEETMEKYNLKLIASSNLDSPSVIDSKGYKYNYNNMTHEFVPEGWLNDGNKANIIPVGDSQIDVDKPTDWDSMVGLYKSPYET